MKSYHLIPLTIALLLSGAVQALGAPDRYVGDTAIYGAAGGTMRPNVLLLIDNNRDMDKRAASEAYDPKRTYTGTFDPFDLYKMSAGRPNSSAIMSGGGGMGADGPELTAVSCVDAKKDLKKYGKYAALPADGLQSSGGNKGKCGSSGSSTLVYLGNLLNYNATIGDDPKTQIQIIADSVKQVVNDNRNSINFGLAVFNGNNKGADMVHPVANLSDDAAYDAFVAAMDVANANGPTGNTRPLSTALYDAGFYFRTGRTSGKLPVSGSTVTNSSPITSWCQKNYIILLSNGDAIESANVADNFSYTAGATVVPKVNDYDKDGKEPSAYGDGSHYLDDVAKFLYEEDLSPSLPGYQRIQTFTIQVFAPYDRLMEQTADTAHGRGAYYVASDAAKVKDAFDKVVATIVVESDTAFVAPVVPSSPENRSYSGKRVYLGFFRPVSGQPWRGNLKKYGIDSANNIIDVNGVNTTNRDGSFSAGSRSYWSAAVDAGRVEQGGTGEVLQLRDIVPSPTTGRMRTAAGHRKIYTYLGTNPNLTHSDNFFDTDNTNLAVPLGLDNPDRDLLIRYIHGLDSYNHNGLTIPNPNAKRNWLMGDILHSKPLLVNFKRYTFTAENERDENFNKTYIFVGSNDGLLHAFRDRDGGEEWAFIPPGLLPDLKYLREPLHSYFVDNSAVTYMHDVDNDGEIEVGDGDKVMILFGTGRGGGKNTLADGSRGAYYALDVSNPVAPIFKRRIDRITYPVDFAEMGETWSVPRLAKVKVNGVRKIVAFVGAGYDNNEDLRFGNTQEFPSGVLPADDICGPSGDFTHGKSTGGGSQVNPQGRGIYAIEIATLTLSGNTYTPNFDNIGTKLWKYTFAENAGMTFSIPSDITTLDRDHDGFVDRLYVGDTGGNLWRFNVGDNPTARLPSTWTGTKIFSANPGGDATNGRKFFYRPAASVLDAQTVGLYFGTGDRSHPQNHKDPGTTDGATIDRLYHIRDRDNDANQPAVIMETNDLVDVTENQLQRSDTSADEITRLKKELLQGRTLNGGYKYGWYIKLDAHAGEKVLAPAAVFSGAAFFTTYTPDTTISDDPCAPGNPGKSRMYAVDSQTGEAVYDFASATASDAYGENQNATDSEISGYAASVAAGSGARHLGQDKDGNVYVKRRADRETSLGSGIPSGLVFIIGEDGSTSALAGSGGSFPSMQLGGEGLITPLYWMQW